MRSKLLSRLLPGLLAAVLGATGDAAAATITLEATSDNTLYEDATGSLSDGMGAYLFSGNTDRMLKRRALVAFNLGPIPPGSTIQSVILTLRTSRTKAGNETIRVHRVLAGWGEGASDAPDQEGQGAPAAPGDATWLHRFYPATLWRTPGSEYSPTESAGHVVGGNGSVSWSSDALALDVQGWVNDPGGNFGWILIGNETTNQTAKRFDSRHSGTPANRPRLSVTYTPPAVTGACCTAGLCSSLSPTECAARGGVYQGDGISCSPNPCQQPSGACCSADGSCAQLGSGSCAATGGAYQGDLTTCMPNPCPQPTGVCCAPSGDCAVLTAAQCGAQGGAYSGDGATCGATDCPVVLAPFVDPLPLPAVAQPTSGSPGGAATYEMNIQEFEQRLHRDLPPTRVWGFNGSYPGPTIEAALGQPVAVIWRNDLRDPLGFLRTEHYLPVDSCLDGPEVHGSAARVVFHLHGGHVPAQVDGYPEATLLPGEQTEYLYPNLQLPATLWYHDHALGITRLNVYMGLAGFYLLRDALEAGLDLPRGEFEIPLAIQDRRFRSDGSLDYPAQWQEHFFGDKILVNGKVWPYLTVKQGKYRFRLLNGSTSRTYRLALSHPGMQFRQIGTDGGLLPAPVPLDEITMGPGERADVVVDFAGLSTGTEVLLTNSAPIMFPGTPGDGVIPQVMKFVVTSGVGHTAPLPVTLRPLARISESEASQQREFELRKGEDPCSGSAWLINGLRWDDVTEYPELGTTEIWSFVNRSGVSHPMHMHLVMFQLLDRQPFEVVNEEIAPTGPAVPAPPNEAGWKDTVMAHPSEITRVIARFEDYTGRFAYHCHILEHEDHEMMRQFQTISCGNGEKEPTEGCDDGNRRDGDLCSARCRGEEFTAFSGVAAGGSVELSVEGVSVGVATSPGWTPAEVAAALAATINANPVLAGLGVSATANGDTVVVGGEIGSVTILDAGLSHSLALRALPQALWWSSVSGRIGYDVVRGDLILLGSSRGDFTVATQACLADDRMETSLPLAQAPAPARGWWFLLRVVAEGGPGTWDDGTESGSRDAEINAAAASCP
jgi:spore coat protein A